MMDYLTCSNSNSFRPSGVDIFSTAIIETKVHKTYVANRQLVMSQGNVYQVLNESTIKAVQ